MSARKAKCSACGGRARSFRRAFVLGGGERVREIRAGRVCPACARNGWLLVMGADTPDTPTTAARKAKRARSIGVLAAHALEAFDREAES